MKKIYLCLIGLVISVASCTNDITESDSSTDASLLKDQNFAPYISPEMQNIINILNDSTQDSISITDLIPSLEPTLIKSITDTTEESSSITKTDDGTTLFTGYNNKSLLFSTTLTLTSGSLLTESMDLGDEYQYLIGQKLYLRCWAVTKNFYFSSATSAFVAYEAGDKSGFDPDQFSTTYTSTTYLPRGFHLDEKASQLYVGTTYIFDYSTDNATFDKTAPWLSGIGFTLDEKMASFLTWRLYALTD